MGLQGLGCLGPSAESMSLVVFFRLGVLAVGREETVTVRVVVWGFDAGLDEVDEEVDEEDVVRDDEWVRDDDDDGAGLGSPDRLVFLQSNHSTIGLPFLWFCLCASAHLVWRALSFGCGSPPDGRQNPWWVQWGSSRTHRQYSHGCGVSGR